MNKKMIPATIAALALTFSTIAVPQAIASEQGGQNEAAEFNKDVELAPDNKMQLYLGTLFGHIGVGGPGAHDQVGEVSFSVEWLDYSFSFEPENQIRELKATEAAPKGDHKVTTTVTYKENSGNATETGELHVTILGDDTDVIGTAKAVTAGDGAQDTGISIAHRTHGINPTIVTATDKNGKSVPVSYGAATEGSEAIQVNPGVDIVGPITLTISGGDLEDKITKSVRVNSAPITTTIDGTVGTVKPAATAQETGLKVSNRTEGNATFTAVDEDGKAIPVTFGKKDEKGFEAILVTPGTDVDGPITVKLEHPAIDAPRTYTIGVEGHAVNRDDNGAEPVVVTGDPKTLNPTDTAQDTGLSIKNETTETSLSAKDEDGTALKVEIAEGKLMLTPGTKVDGPITLTVSDESLDKDRTFIIEVEGHAADRDDNDTKPSTPSDPDEDKSSSLSAFEGSSEESGEGTDVGISIDWGAIGILGVIAAVVGVIAAIGGGFLPMF